MKIVLERGDGPTSSFVAGRLGIEPGVLVVLSVLTAVILVAVVAGIIIYIKKKRKEE
ncbi:MAG: hypothetical protein K2J90_11370 [Lachnospiraceae bacterium]|nr:hypothetical protein [Lachnospiraceae bacterium]